MIVILEGSDCEIIDTLSLFFFLYFFFFPLILQLLPLSLFESFLPWGTLGFDTGLINFSLSFCFFDVLRILSLIGLLCFGG